MHRVGHRLCFHFVTDSASSLSIGTGLAGTTTLPLFALPRFWSCYCPLGCFHPKVRPLALKGTCFQPFPALREFNSPLDGAPSSELLSIVAFLSRGAREYTSPFSLHEGKLERPKTTRCLQRSEWSLQTECGCSNLHTMATLGPKNGRTFSLCTRRPNAVSVQTLA